MPVTSPSFPTEQPHLATVSLLAQALDGLLGFIEAPVLMDVHKMPVVETSPPDGMRVSSESEGLNEMEGAAGRSTESGHIARIRRYLRLHEDHMEWPDSRPGSKPTRGDADRGVF
jgi:hypothetical protein